MKTLYTVRRYKKYSAILYGKKHGADNVNQTVCGLDLSSGYWWITHNDFGGDIDCKKCLKALKDRPETSERLKVGR